MSITCKENFNCTECDQVNIKCASVCRHSLNSIVVDDNVNVHVNLHRAIVATKLGGMLLLLNRDVEKSTSAYWTANLVILHTLTFDRPEFFQMAY